MAFNNSELIFRTIARSAVNSSLPSCRGPVIVSKGWKLIDLIEYLIT
jgi:hypothetical protein